MTVNLKPGKNLQTAAIAGAAGAGGAIITLVAIAYAFRIPKELKKFSPKPKKSTNEETRNADSQDNQ